MSVVHLRESASVKGEKGEENLHKSSPIYPRKRRFHLRILLISFHLLNFTLDETPNAIPRLGTISCRRITSETHVPCKIASICHSFRSKVASPPRNFPGNYRPRPREPPSTCHAFYRHSVRYNSTTVRRPRSSTSSLIGL